MSTTLTETISNKLIFNLLTPKGFISLTDYGNSGSIVEPDDAPSEDTNPHLEHSDSSDSSELPGDGNTIVTGDASRFSLGREVITASANAVLTDEDVDRALRRHGACDWGEVTKDDWARNDSAIKKGERIVSSYRSSRGKDFWIITEWDRSATMVLLPDEY